MDITGLSGRLLSEISKHHDLPEKLLHSLPYCSTQQYLNTLAELALDPAYTEIVYATNETVFVEISSRLLRLSRSNSLSALAAYARVLPSAPHLADHAATLLEKPHGPVKVLCTRDITTLCQLSVEDLGILLLAIVRLLLFDNERFATFISPAPFSVLLSHDLRHIRYLAIRLLCLYLHASDAALETMVKINLGDTEVEGPWEGKNIDFTFFTLWEHRRLTSLNGNLKLYRRKMPDSSFGIQSESPDRKLRSEDLSSQTACLSNVLVPITHIKGGAASSLVSTDTVQRNLRLLAEGINIGRPLLVTGLHGSGKTKLVNEIALLTGNHSSMVTLHLNHQTDAKLLIGLYTSTKSPGSFAWLPGVLTTAVTEGRWVLIEDLDRAPLEVVSALLPLIERRELHIPNQGKAVLAAPGFKLIATLRTSTGARGEEINPATGIVGLRHWHQVQLHPFTQPELSQMVSCLFPLARPHLPQMMNVYTALTDHKYTQSLHSRPVGPSDLFRWSRRIQTLLEDAGVTSSLERISESTQDNIFLEGVDSLAGSIPQGPIKVRVVEIIAQALHVPTKLIEYHLENRKPAYIRTDSSIRIGRVCLHLSKFSVLTRSPSSTVHQSFAATDHVLRVLESVAVCVQQSEPCLMVGETGAGKTTIIQQLATILDTKLVVVNLSQQSEAGDVLGGYKPIHPRSIAVPMKDEFDELLQLTFPSRQNQRFLDSVAKAIAKGRWKRALLLWEEALGKVRLAFDSYSGTAEYNEKEPTQKKRKLHSHQQDLRTRWNRFADELKKFQLHLSSDPRGMAFSFVEGRIVKAVRDGDWVLLDEINLTSPDTLESLADLFSSYQDDGPSLLLSEKGDIERIRAHKNFRIFGAMNPATDVGKRDLPPSIRSRFTEIFVDAPDKSLADLIAVVRAYLRELGHSDMRAANDAATLYLDIKRLTEANRLIDGSSQKPHFSLRTLTRTLMYVTDIAPMYGLRRALFEGFSMSFLTMLDATSRSLVQPLIEEHILGSQSNQKSTLHQSPRLPDSGRPYVRFRQYWITQGNCNIEEQPHYIITPFVDQNLQNLVRATSTRRFPVLLQGPTSSGKTSLVEYLAKISGNKYVRVNNHEHTDLQEYLGTYTSDPDGQLVYEDGVLVKALKEGHWIVLDELNLAPTDVLEALNRLLDDNRELLVPETQQMVQPHENFMLFATQNPPGAYGGRKALSRAFRNRFLELHFDEIPEDELETILRERSQIAPSFCTRIVAVYKQLSILRQSERLFEQRNSFATLRDLFRWALRDADDRSQLAINGFQLLAERVRNQAERAAVKRVIENVMKVKIDEDQIYGTHLHGPAKTVPDGLPGMTWTKSARRIYVLVMQALSNNEPVLLVGETGSGKTTICQVIAQVMKTQLRVINAHQNLETGDLIGAQRPSRSQTLAQGELAHSLINVLKSCAAYREDFGNDLSTLSVAYDQLVTNTPGRIPEGDRFHIKECKARANILFEWSDGSLVTAMKKGHLFLLDEISLADDSVLERLNSVLEPQRTLFLAEKGSKDAPVTASDGFQFLATMNPGGDYGKRELSPALRNRFTEIWVPLLSNKDEVLEIVQARLISSHMTLAKPMITFADWFASTYETSISNLSIRDLICWSDFINRFADTDLPSAVLDGASMVYLDRLGASPAAKVSVTEDNVSQQRRLCELKLVDLFKMDVASLRSTRPQLEEDEHSVSIGGFRYAKSSLQPSNLRYSLRAPTTLRNAMKILRALQVGKPVLLEGNPGVGKTTLVSALADLTGIPLTRINLSDQTDLVDLFGSDVPIEGAGVGHFGWRDAPFLRAMQQGEWVLLDEMNLASQTVLEGLNACFDHRGEIYVPELDQTFSRHPNFVAFAAQNPHHQGGGRKGLPASFINRFTVVFADPFTQEDLQIICNTNFPSSDPSMVKHIIDCVTHVTLALQSNPRLGSQGGPWEINLRDALRWLELCSRRQGEYPMYDPSHYQQLLFFQRFRTYEDRVAITDLINQDLSDNRSVRSYFTDKQSHQWEIGMGSLYRDELRRPSRRGRGNYRNLNLPIAESVMLCIEKSWPVLLVGAPSTGKTNLILQLAELAGADVVELCLNPEMDTMDLIGSHEQLDSQRELISFTERLRDYTLKAIIQQLVSGDQSDTTLFDVDSRLAAPVTAHELVPLLQVIANHFPSSQYPEFLEECRTIAGRSIAIDSSRFEWVDSSLVKALVQGKWLILDNANLCTPSVLDRLNSLLEPNGCLSINEHRNPDGSVRIIKPHYRFRLFMTMDPRHGELSRAMRNRSVELFMPHENPLPSFSPPSLNPAIESSISRFTSIQKLNFENSDHDLSLLMLLLCFDHLTFADIDKIQRWQSQVLNGLEILPANVTTLFSSVVEVYRQLFCFGGITLKAIRQAYSSIYQDERTPGKPIALQTIHPYNKPNLLDLTAHGLSPFHNLHLLGQTLELLIEIYYYSHRLAEIAEGSKTKAPNQMSKAEQFFASIDMHNQQLDSTHSLSAFLQDMGYFMRDLVDGDPLDSNEDIADRKSMLSYATQVIYYMKDILDIIQSHLYDESTLQVYHKIGRSLSARLQVSKRIGRQTAALADKLEYDLRNMDSPWQLCSGLEMESLWRTFKPQTARTASQLDLISEIESLAGQFDKIRWSSKASLIDLISTQDLLSNIFEHSGNLRQSLHGPSTIETFFDTFNEKCSTFIASDEPFFSQQFDTLHQYERLMPIRNSDIARRLSLLCGEPTNVSWKLEGSSDAWSYLRQLCGSIGTSHPQNQLAVIRQKFSASTICRMLGSSIVPLRSLDLLKAEVSSLADSIVQMSGLLTCDPKEAIIGLMQKVQEKTVEASQNFSSAEKGQEYFNSINQLASRLDGQIMGSIAISHRMPARFATPDFRKAIEAVISPTMHNDNLSSDSNRNALLKLARDMIYFFIGFIVLYVPDKPYDPAMKPKVEHDRHCKRQNELRTKIVALRNYEEAVHGQKYNYRIQVVEKALMALGSSAEPEAIYRPERSEMGSLQGEHNNILRAVIRLMPAMEKSEAACFDHRLLVSEISARRSDIRISISRLSQAYRAYDDITKPLLAVLNGLDAGLSLATLACAEPAPDSDTITYICSNTPFMGAQISESIGISIFGMQQPKDVAYDLRIHFLESAILAKDLELPWSQKGAHAVFQVLQTFFEEWKSRLIHSQKESLASTSLYKFRGGEAESEQAEEEDFADLFPNYEYVKNSGSTIPEKDYNPSGIAQMIAHIHSRLFGNPKNPTRQLLAVLGKSSQIIANTWHECSDQMTCPVPEEHLLSPLLLLLDEKKELLGGTPIRECSYNFYTDKNIVEAQKLVSLVQQVQARFIGLQKSWPEHATLTNVLRTSSELLAIGHTEPIAKFLTKTEQLYSYIHEWQRVASKEYSVATLYDLVTQQLISWRRLELSAWQQLLDREDDRCMMEADSWWFIAYENIIAAPLSMIDRPEESQSFARQLTAILQDFLAATSLGQFHHRLDILQAFQRHIKLLSEEHQSLYVICNTLYSFISYFKRFGSAIKEQLQKGRHALENEVKEVLLLASWKDTNIEALKESAKRSHYRLFKTVRKYRTLLTQPIDTLLFQSLPTDQAPVTTGISQHSIMELCNIDERFREHCRHVELWIAKPDRFKNPLTTARSMLQITRESPHAMNVQQYLDRYTEELLLNMKALQKETPKSMTKDNAETVKHLKSRKRKLYSDTLKDLRQMGFRTTLGTNVLSQQDALPAILSTTPSFQNLDQDYGLGEAQHDFHNILNVVPRARESVREHHADLSHREVIRSVGYLESIVSTILRQRRNIDSFARALTALREGCQKIANITKSDDLQAFLKDQGDLSHRNAITMVLSLPTILDTAVIIIGKYSKLGGADTTDLCTALDSWRSIFTDIIQKLRGLPLLPDGLTSSLHVETYAACWTTIDKLHAALESWSKEYPNLQFVLKQIKPWCTCEQKAIPNQAIGDAATLSHHDAQISGILDSMLMATQRLSEKSANLPKSDEEPRWLICIDTLLTECLKTLQLQKVAQSLNSTLSGMRHLGPGHRDDLKNATAITAMALPIIAQFYNVGEAALGSYIKGHASLCRLGCTLARWLSHIGEYGFCVPDEGSATDARTEEKLEAGIGLGDGEGAEDISKDIRDDEDLSELAQQGIQYKNEDEIQDEESAVNLSHDQLEGEVGEALDEAEDTRDDSGTDKDDVDEETGEVDDLEGTTVDEKIWDGKSKQHRREKEGPDAGQGPKSDDQAAADSDHQAGEVVEDEEAIEDDIDDEVSQRSAEESEAAARDENEALDPNVQSGQNLDLPDEMELDDMDRSDMTSENESIGSTDVMDDQNDTAEDNDVFEEDADQNKALQSAGKDDEDTEKADEASEDELNTESLVNEDLETNGDEIEQNSMLQDHAKDLAVDQGDASMSDAQGLGLDREQADDDRQRESRAQVKHGTEGESMSQATESISGEQSNGENRTSDLGGREIPNTPSIDDLQRQAFKELGDALELWHRQQRQILGSSEDAPPSTDEVSDKSLHNRDLEHLPHDSAEADGQALGAATIDQARALDEQALDSESKIEDSPVLSPCDVETGCSQEPDEMTDAATIERPPESSKPSSKPAELIINHVNEDTGKYSLENAPAEDEESINELDKDLSITHIQSTQDISTRSTREIQHQWAHYESATRDISLHLTEQLRLILAPTLATKMRGDFRTGKRLNMKRIIPYIASQYKKDKIWMRRSIPTKRNYQIMLAVDDSRSMGESGSGHLAFQTLALVSKSLNMLEVGQVCVVGFGNEVVIAHDFEKPLTNEAGAQMLNNFGFQQTKTDVRKLIAESITIFREARRRGFNVGTDLWQLELIISDGVCEDHGTIRRLVRKAQEERIMIVFVIVDALNSGESIMEMSEAVFEPDASGENKLRIKRYLDDFPFPYYLIVGDVKELPGVLAQALKQWFAEVADSG